MVTSALTPSRCDRLRSRFKTVKLQWLASATQKRAASIRISQGQLERLKAEGCGVIRSEKVSGASRDGRPELETIIEFLRAGDELLVTRLDRLGRDVRDVLNIVHDCDQRQAFITVLDPHVTTRGEAGRIVMTVLGMVAQMERRFIKELDNGRGLSARRLMACIEVARGGSTGRRSRLMNAAGLGPTTIATALGCSRMQVYRILKRRRLGRRAQPIRALEWKSRGRRFDSAWLHQIKDLVKVDVFLLSRC